MKRCISVFIIMCLCLCCMNCSPESAGAVCSFEVSGRDDSEESLFFDPVDTDNSIFLLDLDGKNTTGDSSSGENTGKKSGDGQTGKDNAATGGSKNTGVSQNGSVNRTGGNNGNGKQDNEKQDGGKQNSESNENGKSGTVDQNIDNRENSDRDNDNRDNTGLNNGSPDNSGRDNDSPDNGDRNNDNLDNGDRNNDSLDNGDSNSDNPDNTDRNGEDKNNGSPDKTDRDNEDPEGESTDDSGSSENREDLPDIAYPISDDYFSITQYSYHNIGMYMRYSGERFTENSSVPDIDLDIPEGWNAYYEGTHRKEPVIIAVIDTGIDHDHPDLAGNIWINENEIPDNNVDDDGNGYVDDIYGWDFYNNDNSVCEYLFDESTGSYLSDPNDCDDHGTRVAGLIAAVKDNKIGIAGIASVGNIRVMSLKIHGGSNRKGKISDAIKAIKYAESMGASICNISWGTYSYSAPLASAIKNSNMLFICAAGNDGTDNDEQPIYPACFGFDNILSVGFVNADGTLSYNSNYGRNSVDVVVPSTNIMSTIVGSYSSISGSSMAAPQVSAIAALLCSYNDHTWASAIRDMIIGSVKELPDLEKIIRYPGIPSLSAAIQNVGMMPYDPYPPEYTVNVGYDAAGIRLIIDSVTKDASGIGKINYMPGIRTIEDFKNGTEGLVADGRTFYLAKPGVYTFYVSDRAGNATIKTVPILDDIVLPTISDAVLNIDDEMSEMFVSAHVADRHSGIKTVKYLRGKHDISDFRRSGVGTVLTPDEDGNIVFPISDQGTYTIYASDNRGNSTVTTVMAYKRPSLAIALKKAGQSSVVSDQ